jgi:hypothetical protein
MADKGPMAEDGAGGAIDATSVRILYRRQSRGFGWAWRRVPGPRAVAAVIRVDGPSPIVKISPSISLTTLTCATTAAVRRYPTPGRRWARPSGLMPMMASRNH